MSVESEKTDAQRIVTRLLYYCLYFLALLDDIHTM